MHESESTTKWLHLLWIIAVLRNIASAETRTGCVAPAVFTGQPAAVTCILNEDVQKTGRGFSVYRYSPDDKNFTTRFEVLTCFRLELDNMQCTPGEGYSYNGEVSNSATVTIQAAAEEYAGNYLCQLVPPKNEEPNPCEFRLKDPVSGADDTRVFDQGSNTTEGIHPSGEGHKNVAITLGIVCAVLSCVFVCVCVYVLATIRGDVFKERFKCCLGPLLPRQLTSRDTNNAVVELNTLGVETGLQTSTQLTNCLNGGDKATETDRMLPETRPPGHIEIKYTMACQT